MPTTWTEVNNGLINIWWRGGSVVSADVVGAYQAIGARSISDSKINRNDPGTNDIDNSGNNPAFAEATGWTFNGVNHWLTAGIIPGSAYTMIARILSPNGNDGIMGCRVAGSDFSLETAMGVPFTGALRSRWGNGSQDTGQVFSGAAVHVVALAGNTPYVDGVVQTAVAGVWGGAPVALYFGAHNSAGVATDFYSSQIHAVAVYNRTLTAIEVEAISSAMAALTVENTTKSLYVNYIAIAPHTRHLPKESHELWIATEAGIYRTINGGNNWSKILLPDPSNAEFGDAPPATVDELSFDYVLFSPVVGANTIFIRGTKTSSQRMWIYGSLDAGVTWTSRGVVIA
jgi:hypothetical protein